MAQDAPYKLSRAALREKYGPRAITSGGQSERDTTPSGREARAMQKGATPAEAVQYSQRLFREGFGPQQQIIEPIASNILPVGSPLTKNQIQQPQFRGGVASPEDVGVLRSQGAIGTVKTPFGTVTLPNTIPAEEMAQYLPATVSPLNSFALPKQRPYLGGVMQATSRWRT